MQSMTGPELMTEDRVLYLSTVLNAIPSQFNSVPNKIPLEFESSATWAEIILVRLLEGDGWSAAWFKNWGGRAFWRDVKQVATLPKYATDKFKQVYAASGGRGGCWDIFACRDGEFLFVESKHRGRDRIRTSQARWLETALDAGIPASSFAIVEWRIS
jgi:hypothetical protein